MEYLAHSARDGAPEQSYLEHVQDVTSAARQFAEAAGEYATQDGKLLLTAVTNAAPIHDLGKLDKENQKVLHVPDSHKTLPIPHDDAGVSLLAQAEEECGFSQLLVSSHHIGLPDLPIEEQRGDKMFRSGNPEIRNRTDVELAELKSVHDRLIPGWEAHPEGANNGDISVLCRMMLSCLADADHSDTARHYGKYPLEKAMPELMPEKRLERLNAYVGKLGSNQKNNERNQLRSELYASCRDHVVDENIAYCDCPVGSGKTTAVMAHLLRAAAKRKARRVFVVLPYTNIIRQSVEVYRKALTMDGETPEDVVAELHHLADFESENARQFSAQWRSPIIVTTAVAFFETLASNRPSTLRRLHELPGSVIFVDEAHAAMPVKLLPVAWHWMKAYAEDWSCYWLLASGSLVKFWKLEGITGNEEQPLVPSIVPESIDAKLLQYEQHRVEFCHEAEPLSVDMLIEKVMCSPGPRLVIMNTINNAALVAGQIANKYGREYVEHLSTALTAEDREKTVKTVKERLADKCDEDWTLVATSCVEAGVDFSFQTGFREIASLLSLLQAAGRVNRNGDMENAVMWSFRMQDSKELTKNPQLDISISILNDLFGKKLSIAPEFSTEAIRLELGRRNDDLDGLTGYESICNFPKVAEKFKIIDSDTVLVAADDELKKNILQRTANWRDIQRKCVSIRRKKIDEYHLPELCEGVHDWNLGYDSFLGIMAGELKYKEAKDGFMNV